MKESPKLTILVIEDDLMLLNLYITFFEHNNYKVLTAETGTKGLEIYNDSSKNISVIILDMVLPDINGEDVLNKIQEIDPNQHVILCSGFHSKISKNFPGNVQILQKPFITDTMLTMIQDAVK